MLRGLFADKPVYRKFLILVSLLLFSTLIFSMVGGLLVHYVYGIDIMNNPELMSNLEDPLVVGAMKILQMLTTGIGMFIIPSLVAALLFHEKPAEYLCMTKKVATPVFFYTIIIMFMAVPLINFMLVFNEQLHLPGFLSFVEEWMKASEASAKKITEAFLVMNTTQDLMYNLLLIAVLPAIGEELLFRGILQRLFKEMTGNIHLTVIITAALFSAIHMQFYGFLPRMMLGMLFGYLLVWTGSIWVPILAHFINNGAAVVFAYLAGKNQLPFNQDTIGTEQGDLPLTIISIILVTVTAFLIKKTSERKTEGIW